MQQNARPSHRLRNIANDVSNIKQLVNHEDESLKNQLNSCITDLQRKIKPYIVNVASGSSKAQKTESVPGEVWAGLQKYEIDVPDNWTEGDYEYETSNEEAKEAEDAGVDQQDQQIQSR